MELQKSLLWVLCGLLVSLLMGALSCRWIEIPSKKYLANVPSKRATWTMILCVIVPLCFTSWILIKKGIPNRVALESELALQEQKNTNPRDKECHISSGIESPGCIYGGPNIKAIVIGDSHANAIVNAVAAARVNLDDGVLELSYSACPILKDAKILEEKVNPGHQCHAFVQNVLKKLNSNYTGIPVIIINRWAQYAIGRNEKALESNIPWVTFGKKQNVADVDFLSEYSNNIISTACQIASGRKVYLLRPIPEMGVDVPSKLARNYIFRGDMDVILPFSDYMRRQNFIWDAQDRARNECGVEILDPTLVLCTDGVCHGAENGRPLYFDDDHLSESGNRKIISIFRPVFN